MSDHRQIEVGDVVNVHFVGRPNYETLIGYQVLHRPGNVGETWVLQRADGKLIEVILFERMELVRTHDGRGS